MTQPLIVAAAAATLLTAFAHTYFGERRLVAPLVASSDGVMAHPLAKQVVRLAWHLTSLLWVGQALLLLRAAFAPQAFDRAMVAGIGLLHLAVGLFDALFTRGRHIGWPLLAAIGLLALLSLI